MSDLKRERIHKILTPGHETFMLEILVPTIKKPDLLAKSSGD
jgi:hypothetical protein